MKLIVKWLSGITLGSYHRCTAPCPGPWVQALGTTNSFWDPITTSMLYSWFYLVYLIWYVLFVKQKIENKRNLLKKSGNYVATRHSQIYTFKRLFPTNAAILCLKVKNAFLAIVVILGNVQSRLTKVKRVGMFKLCLYLCRGNSISCPDDVDGWLHSSQIKHDNSFYLG